MKAWKNIPKAVWVVRLWSAVASAARHRFGYWEQSKAPSPLRSAGALQKGVSANNLIRRRDRAWLGLDEEMIVAWCVREHTGAPLSTLQSTSLAVMGDPLRDITELERVAFVMKGGEVVRNDLTRPG